MKYWFVLRSVALPPRMVPWAIRTAIPDPLTLPSLEKAMRGMERLLEPIVKFPKANLLGTTFPTP
jgi:hypothetical protein